jgi:hypothetical protein
MTCAFFSALCTAYALVGDFEGAFCAVYVVVLMGFTGLAATSSICLTGSFLIAFSAFSPFSALSGKVCCGLSGLAAVAGFWVT